jgi:hypothetical protein
MFQKNMNLGPEMNIRKSPCGRSAVPAAPGCNLGVTVPPESIRALLSSWFLSHKLGRYHDFRLALLCISMVQTINSY